MNIIQLMDVLPIDKVCARRPNWVDGQRLVRFCEVNIEMVNIHDENYPNSAVIWEFTCEDLSADDWIIVDGKE